jgi:chemotaxis protein methyltransferase CheR
VELFASDLSERALEKAQAGIYSQFEVQRGLPARTLVRHFEKLGEAFALSPRIRQMVRWRRVNLMDDLARFGQFDLVLCRGAAGPAGAGGREPRAAPPAGALRRAAAGAGPEGRPGRPVARVGPGVYAAATTRSLGA